MNKLAVHQKGSTLLVALMMLIILTFIVFSAIHTSSTSTRIVGNIQDRKELEADLQRAIEHIMSDAVYFTTDLGQKTVTIDSKAITIGARSCMRALPAEGDSIVEGTTPGKQYTMWDVVASYTDSSTGAKATIHQGVSVLLPYGNCL